MQPMNDVNDSQKSIYTEPTNSYEDINNTSNANPAIIKRKRYDLKDLIKITILSGILVVLLLLLCFVVGEFKGKPLDEEKYYSTEETSINTYDMNIEVLDYDLHNTTATVKIEVENKSANDLYLTAKGMYLTSDNNVYCTNVLSAKLSSKFYGRPIVSQEKVKATLVFENVTDKPHTLVITNIYDTEHLAWTNAIMLE